MTPRRLLSILVTLTQHTIGTGVIFAATFWVNGSREVVAAAADAWEWGVFSDNSTSFAIQFALAASLWALIVIAFKLAQLGLRRTEDGSPQRVVLRARGTVMTETLIVIPVFLLLTLGLLQLTLNNTGALFTSLGAFQAGRTVYLWSPENNGSSWARNGGVSTSQIVDKARIAAASVLAPVTPSEYMDEGCTGSPEFNSKLEAMMSTTIGAAGSLGNASAGTIRAIAAGRERSTRNNLTVNQAFDTDKFAVRGPVKMLLAYCHTSIRVKTQDGMHKVEVTFSQKQTMPLVGPIFGTVVGPSGRYSNAVRTYEIPEQIHPNPNPPTSIFAFLNFNPFSAWN